MREVSLHPPNMTDTKGRLLPTSFIPFCAYQANVLGVLSPELPFTSCSLAQATVLDGQICYNLKVTTQESKKDRKNGLLLLLDFGPKNDKATEREDEADETDMDNSTISYESSFEDKTSVRIFLQTLSRFSSFKMGSYAMSAFQRMIGTKSFLDFPDDLKKCQVEALEDCHTKKYFERVQEECGCVPWGLDKLAAVDSGVSQQVETY